jgi:hypothetical protein
MRCCTPTPYQAALTGSTTHRKRITVSKANAKLVCEIHRLIKGQDIGVADDVIAVGQVGGCGKQLTGDYMEDAQQMSFRKL